MERLSDYNWVERNIEKTNKPCPQIKKNTWSRTREFSTSILIAFDSIGCAVSTK